MSKAIWKYEIKASEDFSLDIPVGGEILCVQAQGDVPRLWALVDPKVDKERRTFRVLATGQEIPDIDSLTYVGTFQTPLPARNMFMLPSLVWHVFEKIS